MDADKPKAQDTTVKRVSDRELVVTRVVNGPARLVFRAWTQADLMKRWWVPESFGITLVSIDMDARVGGGYKLVFAHPAGEGTMAFFGTYTEVVPNEKLVWTNALAPGFRPVPAPVASADDCCSFLFTAVLTLQPEGSGTRYRALVIHRDAEGRKMHSDMGFHDGWGQALDQLVALMQQR